MKRFLTYLLFPAILAWFVSCDKEEAKPTKARLLTAHTWAISKIEVNGDDVTNGLGDCNSDNTVTFKQDGTYVENIGENKCADDEANVNGTWSFRINETLLVIHPYGSDEESWEVNELTNGILKISRSEAGYTIVFSFVPE